MRHTINIIGQLSCSIILCSIYSLVTWIHGGTNNWLIKLRSYNYLGEILSPFSLSMDLCSMKGSPKMWLPYMVGRNVMKALCFYCMNRKPSRSMNGKKVKAYNTGYVSVQACPRLGISLGWFNQEMEFIFP